MTVRDNDGSIVQFLYGEDSIDVMNTKFLDKFAFLEQNFTSLITNYNAAETMKRIDKDEAKKFKKEAKKHIKKVTSENPHWNQRQIIKA